MPIKLFISPQEIQQTTIMGGNVDIDSFQFCIDSVQATVIEPLLGTLLYDKIVTDYTADNLSGLYLELFEKFVQPITKYESTAQYINIAQLKLNNGGIFKHAPENAEIVSKKEVEGLASVYHSRAMVDVGRFNKWICKNTLPEYKIMQEEVNANKNTQLVGGLWFGNNSNACNDNCDDCTCIR